MSQSQEPFLLADDYVDESTPNPSTPDQILRPQPGTIPERMLALEVRVLSMEKMMRTLMPVLKKQQVWAKIAQNITKFAPIWVPVLAAQFPKAKAFLQAFLDSIAILQ